MRAAIPQATDPDIELVYVGDPMCSWCWAFDPVLRKLDERYLFPVRTIVGGLRPGPGAEPLDDRMRSMLLHHWEEIAARTGQPFDHRQLDRAGWVYDTEVPARAVVTMRELAPHLTMSFFSRLQRAFYAEVVDVTNPEAVGELASEFAVDHATFMARFGDDESKRAAWRDFAEARRFGVSGFPTLLVRVDEQHAVVSRGYAAFEDLEPPLTAWLDERAEITGRGLVCDIDGVC